MTILILEELFYETIKFHTKKACSFPFFFRPVDFHTNSILHPYIKGTLLASNLED